MGEVAKTVCARHWAQIETRAFERVLLLSRPQVRAGRLERGSGASNRSFRIFLAERADGINDVNVNLDVVEAAFAGAREDGEADEGQDARNEDIIARFDDERSPNERV